MPTIQSQLQAQIQAQTQDIKKLQDDIRRLKEDFGRNKEFDRKDDDDIKEDVDIKEKKQPLLLFAIIIGVVIVPFIAFSINNTMRLNEYDRKLKDLEKFKKNIDGLNEITSDIPILESRVTDVKKQIRGIEIFMPNATQDIAYLKRELENMNSTENKVKDIESSVSSIHDSYVELKKLSDLQKEQLKQFNTSINTTNTQIISLSKNADVANSTLAPIIQNQTELLKNITDSNVRMLEINDTVNSITLRLLDVSRNITDLQPQLEIVGKAAAQMTEMQKDVDKLQTETRNVKSSMSTMKLETKEAELKVSNMSTKVDEYSSVVTGHEEKLKTLQEEQSEVDNKIKMSNKNTKKLENDVSDAKDRVGELKIEVTESDKNVKTIKSEIDEAASKIQKEMWFCNVSIDALNDTIANLSKEVSSNATYIEKTLPTVVSDVKTLQTLAAFPWMSVVSVFDVFLILVLIAVYLKNHHWYVKHSKNDIPQNPNGNGHERTQGNVFYVRPQSILDRIQRVPVLDNKVCVLSFYSETMNLHKQLVQSALATSRRGKNIEIIQHLVRKHEDIPNIPGARYIFVFVDFNTRNIILETKEDLGDKKITTVEAAQKIGADVFVTYFRDKESNQLHPGNLFNQKLSAFTSHPVLKELGNKQRCFSVYETFNNTQKESIVRSIK